MFQKWISFVSAKKRKRLPLARNFESVSEIVAAVTYWSSSFRQLPITGRRPLPSNRIVQFGSSSKIFRKVQCFEFFRKKLKYGNAPRCVRCGVIHVRSLIQRNDLCPDSPFDAATLRARTSSIFNIVDVSESPRYVFTIEIVVSTRKKIARVTKARKAVEI